MKRLLPLVTTLLLVLPVAAFGVFVLINWGRAVEIADYDPVVLKLRFPMNFDFYAPLGEIMLGAFVFGALMGALAALLSLAARNRALADTIDRLKHDNRRLAAASRALEAALPVLREGYDEAIDHLAPESAAGEPAPLALPAPERAARGAASGPAAARAPRPKTPAPEPDVTDEGADVSVADEARLEEAKRTRRRR